MYVPFIEEPSVYSFMSLNTTQIAILEIRNGQFNILDEAVVQGNEVSHINNLGE